MFHNVKNKQLDLTAIENLSKELEIPFLLSSMLYSRGIHTMDDAAAFLTSDYELFDPFLLKDMNRAVDRIEKAIKRKEKIYIVGDFDVDGITSTSILLRFFSSIGFPVFNKLPTQKEGHGLSTQAVDFVKDNGGHLIITVDNGSTSYDAVNLALTLNIDVIITDHHDISKDGVPAAFAVINPKQETCLSPFKFLSGGGLALYLARAIAIRLGYEVNLTPDLFVLAAISTIADVAPLSRDNRKIVKTGLENFHQSGITGLNLLLESKRAAAQYGSRDISFNIAPTINAAGKFGFGDDALDLLTISDYLKVSGTVEKLLKINEDRKELVKVILPDLMIQAEAAVKKEDLVIVIKGNHNSAVSGLIASRLTENFQKPVIVISFLDGEETGRASCRSIDGFNMQEAIEELSEFHLGGGGHYMAAGFALNRDQYDSFVRLINIYAKEHMKVQQKKTWTIDGEFSISQMRQKMFSALQLMEPFGAKNENALLKIRGIKLKQATYGQWVSYHCQIENQNVRVYGNTEPQMGHIPTGKEINAIIEIVFKEGQPIFLLKDFEE